MSRLIVAPSLIAARRGIAVAAVSRRWRVVALSAVIALSAVHESRAEGGVTLVYVVFQEADVWPQPDGLALVRPDGSPQVRLTYGADTEPTWSPDGSSIAFSRSSDIHVIPAAGGSPVNLTNHPSIDSSPAWSPDGHRIVFASNRDGPLALYLMNADGSGISRLTGNLVTAGGPAWSPDGSAIAFNCIIESGNYDVCTVTVDGSTLTRLTTAPGRDSDAAWSPDGGTIAFATERYGTTSFTDDGEAWFVAEIALMNADGSGVRQLRAGTAAEYPSWSPDGVRIAVDVGLYFMNPDVAVMNVDGTGAVTIATRGGSAAWGLAAGNYPPTAVLGTMCGSHTCTFNASASTDMDGSIVSYAWDFGDGTTGSGVSATHTYPTVNPYTATLTIRDDSGASTSRSVTVEPNNRPASQFSATCEGVACRFDGSSSADADGTLVRHAWSFGDGASAEGPVVSHTYNTPGLYAATLTVTDNDGATATQSRTAIAARAPIAAFTVSCTLLLCTFDGSASTDADGTITSYEWYFGDGRYGSGAIVSHAYRWGATFTISLAVRDNLGLSTVLHKWVRVPTVLPPVASFTSVCGNLACAFDASASLPIEGVITTYYWDFGDGSSGSGRTVNHTYQAPGTYPVLLAVRNSSDASAEQRTNLTVTSVASHVGDIDGAVNRQGALWGSTVTLEIHGEHHAPLANLRVTGSWSNGVVAQCTTATNGRCTVQLGGLSKQTRSVSFTVTSVSEPSSYRPDRNHDPDDDSNGTTVVVKRP